MRAFLLSNVCHLFLLHLAKIYLSSDKSKVRIFPRLHLSSFLGLTPTLCENWERGSDISLKVYLVLSFWIRLSFFFSRLPLPSLGAAGCERVWCDAMCFMEFHFTLLVASAELTKDEWMCAAASACAPYWFFARRICCWATEKPTTLKLNSLCSWAHTYDYEDEVSLCVRPPPHTHTQRAVLLFSLWQAFYFRWRWWASVPSTYYFLSIYLRALRLCDSWYTSRSWCWLAWRVLCPRWQAFQIPGQYFVALRFTTWMCRLRLCKSVCATQATWMYATSPWMYWRT